ncbi:hypothetical protein [Streptomyces sp. BRA346]
MPLFADALDSGASLLELDVSTNAFGSGWRVSHGDPAPAPPRPRPGRG